MLSVNELEDRLIDLAFAEDIGVVFQRTLWANRTFSLRRMESLLV